MARPLIRGASPALLATLLAFVAPLPARAAVRPAFSLAASAAVPGDPASAAFSLAGDRKSVV